MFAVFAVCLMPDYIWPKEDSARQFTPPENDESNEKEMKRDRAAAQILWPLARSIAYRFLAGGNLIAVHLSDVGPVSRGNNVLCFCLLGVLCTPVRHRIFALTCMQVRTYVRTLCSANRRHLHTRPFGPRLIRKTRCTLCLFPLLRPQVSRREAASTCFEHRTIYRDFVAPDSLNSLTDFVLSTKLAFMAFLIWKKRLSHFRGWKY